jgi:hypothetical protein
MKKLLRFSLMLIGIVISGSQISLYCQGKKEIKYTDEFRFYDGIYLYFDQVKMNSPIPKNKILSSTDYNEMDFCINLMAGKKIIFYDEMGIRHEVERNSVWGYASNCIIYVQITWEI